MNNKENEIEIVGKRKWENFEFFSPYKSRKKQTLEIIERLKLGEGGSRLAKEYGISRQRVSKIKKTWLEEQQ